jgi:branched-chain amino acid transport system ATP-binding protein
VLEGVGVTKHFGGLAALDDVDFEVREGEILGLIGPNGAGKTTLLNCISGVFQLTGGDIRFLGESIVGLKPHQIARRGIGRTFQIVEPFSSMTVKENVIVSALFGRAGSRRSVAEAEEKAEAVLDFLELADKAELSTQGITVPDMKRVEFARALGMEPKLLLLDEVMAGLTPTEVQGTMDLIQKVRDTGITVLVIEHVMKAIMGCCDRVLVLHHGKKVSVGTCSEIACNEAVIAAYLGERYARRKAQTETVEQGAE